MTLVQAWIDSVQLLKPKNLQLFVMVTLKSIIEAYKLLLKYFWWLVLVCLMISGYRLLIVDSRDIYSLARYAQVRAIGYFLYTLLFLGICFITRPSIAKKDCVYFRAQYRKIIVYWLLWVILSVVAATMYRYMPSFWIGIPSVWYIFSVLFFADSSGGPKNFLLSIWYALKMIIFNLPLLFIVGAFFYCTEFLFFQSIKRTILFFISEENGMAQALIYVRIIHNFLGVLLMPIGICTYANIYIKKLHDQFDLYVSSPQ